jgi:tryptophan synthase alpha chain
VNPVVRLGYDRFAREAAAAGVDGVLVLDLPLEEAGPLHAELTALAIDMVFLLSPTTTEERIREAARLGRGFLYVISRLGVTGARDTVAEGADALARRVRAITSLPLALGFGLSRPEHVAAVGRFAEAAVVGSALVSVIAREAGRADLPDRVERYVRWLKGRGPALEAMAS